MKDTSLCESLAATLAGGVREERGPRQTTKAPRRSPGVRGGTRYKAPVARGYFQRRSPAGPLASGQGWPCFGSHLPSAEPPAGGVVLFYFILFSLSSLAPPLTALSVVCFYPARSASSPPESGPVEPRRSVRYGVMYSIHAPHMLASPGCSWPQPVD